jgi:hypothetical protein
MLHSNSLNNGFILLLESKIKFLSNSETIKLEFCML